MSFQQDFVQTAGKRMGELTPIYRSEDVVTKLANSYLSDKDYVKNNRGIEFAVRLPGKEKDVENDRYSRPTISYSPRIQADYNPLLESLKHGALYDGSAIAYRASKDNYRTGASEPMNRN